MTPLGIVATCLAGLFVYSFGWAFVFLRLRWRFKEAQPPREANYYNYHSDQSGLWAFWAATVLPVGLGLVAFYSLMVQPTDGLPPRRVRQAQREQQQAAQQAAEIERLQQEIDAMQKTS